MFPVWKAAGQSGMLPDSMESFRNIHNSLILHKTNLLFTAKAIWVLQIKVWKRVDPPPPMWNLFIKKIFFLLQMNASLRFQVSGACLTLDFDFWAQGAQFMCLPKTPNIILGQKLGLNPPPGSQTLMTTRVFKLVRHFAGLQSLLHTLQQAYQVPIMKCWPV